MKCWRVVLLLGLGCGAALAALAQQARVIVSFKPDAAALREWPMAERGSPESALRIAQHRADRLVPAAGRALSSGRAFGPRAQVVRASGIDSAALAAQLAQHPEVEFAVVDRRRRALRVPADPLFTRGPSSGLGPDVGQWYLRAPSAAVASAINAEAAWDRVTASASVVVAVLDTGVLSSHPDLAGVVLPGYDMIHDADTAGDGDGRDANATDPGDFVTSAEASTRGGPFFGCEVGSSSWHGTKVAGVIGAVADNGVGIAGTAYGVRILPLRVLGKCGGYDSDILAGMYWAAGITQPGLPNNPNPARVLNLSLGGEGACDAAYRQAVSQITAHGASIVAAAGNSVGHAVGSPANCAGVIGVAGIRHAGSKVGFSDLGPEVTISAPAGNCVLIGAGDPCLFPIVTTGNNGTRSPLAAGSNWTNSYDIAVGTSFSAPLVAGTVALMVSARPSLTPAQIINALKRSARPFPTTGADSADGLPLPICRAPNGTDQDQCYCTSALCGAGMLDALAAVQVVLTPGSAEEVARQAMNHGEATYPMYFHERPATQSSPPFLYRYYPGTGVYLGVVVQPGMGYARDDVYVMGGPFGESPVRVGKVSDYIVPLTTFP